MCTDKKIQLQRVSQIWASYIFQLWFGFKLKPIFNTAPAASKNTAQFKSGQNRLKKMQIAS